MYVAIGISVFVFVAVLFVIVSLVVRHYRQKITRHTHHVTFASNSSQRPLLNSDNHMPQKTQPHQMTVMPLTSLKIVENPAYQTKNPSCGSFCKFLNFKKAKIAQTHKKTLTFHYNNMTSTFFSNFIHQTRINWVFARVGRGRFRTCVPWGL